MLDCGVETHSALLRLVLTLLRISGLNLERAIGAILCESREQCFDVRHTRMGKVS